MSKHITNIVMIDTRESYELYVKNRIRKNLKMGDAMKKAVVSLVMQSFDDGIAYNQLNLKVEVPIGTSETDDS